METICTKDYADLSHYIQFRKSLRFLIEIVVQRHFIYSSVDFRDRRTCETLYFFFRTAQNKNCSWPSYILDQ